MRYSFKSLSICLSTNLAAIIFTFGILSSAILAPAPAAAGERSIFEDEIVVTATGKEVPTEDVPAPVTVIDRQEIDDSQADSVSQLLRRVPGITMMQSGGEGSVTSLFMRGTESDHTLVLFDGIRLNSPYFGGYDWSLATTAGLDRIEIARGPYSALWGADAIGGVVNMIPGSSKKGSSGRLTLEGGSDDWRRYEGNFSYKSGAFDFFGSGIRREGDQDLENSDFETTEFIVDVGYSWGTGSRIALLVQDLESDTGIPYSGATPTPNRRQVSENRLIAVPMKWQIATNWKLDFTASTVERDFAFSDPDDAFGFTFSETQADTTELRLASHHTLGSHTLSWGGGWRNDEVKDLSTFGVNLDGDEFEVTSFFAQDLWKIGTKVNLIVGARWDETDEWGSEVSPRVNLGWQLTNDFELRLGYGEAFRQPSIGELYFPFSGNPDLKAETSQSMEIGFVFRKKPSGRVWQLNFFSTDLSDMISFDYASYTSQNIGAANIKGAEFGLTIPAYGDFVNDFAVTYLDTEDEATGLPLLRRPEWSGSYTVSGQLWERVRGDVSMLYVGSRDDIDPVTFERAKVPSYTTFNLAAAWQMYGEMELTLRIINLTGEDYQEVLGYPSPGRRYLAGIRFDL